MCFSTMKWLFKSFVLFIKLLVILKKKKNRSIWKVELQEVGVRGRQRSPKLWFSPPVVAMATQLVQSKVMSQEVLSGLPHGFRGSTIWIILQFFPRYVSRELNQKWSKKRRAHMGCWYFRQWFYWFFHSNNTRFVFLLLNFLGVSCILDESHFLNVFLIISIFLTVVSFTDGLKCIKFTLDKWN